VSGQPGTWTNASSRDTSVMTVPITALHVVLLSGSFGNISTSTPTTASFDNLNVTPPLGPTPTPTTAPTATPTFTPTLTPTPTSTPVPPTDTPTPTLTPTLTPTPTVTPTPTTVPTPTVTPVPVFVSTFSDDFERRGPALGVWTGLRQRGNGDVQTDTSHPHGGQYAAHFTRDDSNPNSQSSAWLFEQFARPNGGVIWACGWFRFDSIPDTRASRANTILYLRDSDNPSLGQVSFAAHSGNHLEATYVRADGVISSFEWSQTLPLQQYVHLCASNDVQGRFPVITWYADRGDGKGRQVVASLTDTSGLGIIPNELGAGAAILLNGAYPDPTYDGRVDMDVDDVQLGPTDPG
jgi:hypothetical protein